ncbi:hypothetical protein C8R47DRAFT_1076187 [Mycena vitilis]|nr:hypothetical protein C8R47DRAFT_1076187 [Mycena vitilis]
MAPNPLAAMASRGCGTLPLLTALQTPRVHIPTYIPLATTDSQNSSIWSIYVEEAETYNKALVASWSDNVTGILIFRATKHFSRTPDKRLRVSSAKSPSNWARSRGATTAAFRFPPLLLLLPRALPLFAIFSGSQASASASRVPLLRLWLVKFQWAQNFLQCAGMHSPPVVGARIMSFLYYGIRRFNMHAVVALIPLLMHMSLFFFFAGLVAFLIPVNLAVVVVCSAIPLAFLAIYATLSLLPLRHLDCPYRTPLSDVFWSLLRWYRRIIKLQATESSQSIPLRKTIVDAMIREATADTEERAARDCRALTWTVKCLVDDKQLQEFIRCIPSLIQEGKTVSHRYRKHILDLITNPDIQLYVRIEGMLRTASAGISGSQADLNRDSFAERRHICYQAMWAIAKLEPTFVPVTDTQLIASAYSKGELGRFLLPLVTVTQNRAFYVLDMEMNWVINYLRTRGPLLVSGSAKAADLQCVFDCIVKMQCSNIDGVNSQAFEDILKDRRLNFVPSSAWIGRTAKCIQHFRTDAPYLMLFRYLALASAHSNGTYEHEYTYNSFELPSVPFSPTVHAALHKSLIAVRGVRQDSPFVVGLMQQLNLFVTVGKL